MNHFVFKEKELYCEDVPLRTIAEAVGTPCYIYSAATLLRHFKAFDGAFSGIRHLTCFSMKSNSNLAVIRLFASEGGGVDIVSGGELYRALKAGVCPDKIVYSGVGKTADDLASALEAGILMFNLESYQEMSTLNEAALRKGRKAPVAFRVNPDVDPKTHPYISTGLKKNKFGIGITEAVSYYKAASELGGLHIAGVSCHIGSQLTMVSPFVDALKKVKDLLGALEDEGIKIQILDIGGGLGITYNLEEPPHPGEYADAVKRELSSMNLTLVLEPGRVLVGNAGVLVTKVLYTKKTASKDFFIVDAAMNDLVRPSLYDSYHAIVPLRDPGRDKIKADIVGPICESGDFFARDREIENMRPGEYAAIMSAGAYGFSMSSNYNSRPRPAEVLVKGNEYHVIRARETFEDLVRGETIPRFLLER
ncbi:MAG: diaminopimelate decarboxylase [Deltaproteobacteria bacterium CG_4_8_14_3_um_filter_51_11]|nr:diaminopimelate decarboxylase [bacterium]OIP43217.1 MAG: diaminopimelate decarboxylase [Desulfobacteraceae bacterium CG2_30_51_40]PIP45605.1 MAG: diaminopimelate decarboxylase [Deltaproteobacteria bacterium CG23_combo_of_CG06-09_8_20_14_all_51_20]PIX20155.1 MAG: diaminopimelate decarboxylase [Deltaproteobacteria bacterium CG_4_8_14_3_um_filter_51_11]PJB35970.1 MAG: diaminopimelate decarboxylase [Deltaproteobacteria bacterium CG_4_9_14_3_um_filter_51_14]